MDMVAIGRVVLTRREHIIGLKPLDKGLMGTLRDPPSPMVSTTRPFAVGGFQGQGRADHSSGRRRGPLNNAKLWRLFLPERIYSLTL